MTSDDMKALLDPTGTKIERLTRLLSCAKALGFADAHEAWWDPDNAEWPMESLEQVADGGACGVFEVQIGLFLDTAVFVECHYEEAEDDHPTSVHDTKAAAEAVQGAERGGPRQVGERGDSRE